jgi:hypothetical protein
MTSVICRNTFLDFEEEGKEKSRSLHQGGQRARSAESVRRDSHEEIANEMVELQLVRLNRLLELDPVVRRPFTEDATAMKGSQETEPASNSELMQLQKKLQQALVTKIPSSTADLSKMPSVLSNTSISTMCSMSDMLDDAELDFENGEDDPSMSAPRAPQAVSTQMTLSSSTGLKEAAHESMQQTGPFVAARPIFSKVPRSLDLAAEYERSSSAGSKPTTIMIRNIPNRYSQRELMLELEELGFVDSFDFVYIPMDKCTRANLGYAFVNFVEATWADKCLGAFQNYRFQRHRDVSSKIAAASVAHIQGLDNNLAHYANSVVNSSRHKQRRPVVLAKVSNTVAA